MPKHVYLRIEMGIVDLPKDATEEDYGNEVLKNIKDQDLTLDEMGHNIFVEDDEDRTWSVGA